MEDVEKAETLTVQERSRLTELEIVIRNTRRSFIDCAKALVEVRESKLYRQEFPTFEAYCKARWDWTPRRANQIIEAGLVVDGLSSGNHGSQIKNERQARELAHYDEKSICNVLEEVQKDGKPLTAARIKQVGERVKRDEKKDVELDKTGYPIPPDILSEWHRAEGCQELLSDLSSVKVCLERGLEDKDPIYGEILNTTLADLKGVYADIKRLIPYAVCTSCAGQKPVRCALCRGRGWLSKFLFDTAVPSEIKQMRRRS